MAKSKTKLVNIKNFTDLGEVGGVVLRLMKVVQDCSFANHAFETWKQEKGKYTCRKVGALHYFLRLQLSHIFEAFRIVEEIEKNQKLREAVRACDSRTQRSFEELLKFKKSDDFKFLRLVRNKIGFHNDPEFVVRSLRRIARQQKKRRSKRQPANEFATLTLGDEPLDWYFSLTGMVENDIVVHTIFNLPEDEDPAVVNANTDEILMRLNNAAHVLNDFAGHFAWACMKY